VVVTQNAIAKTLVKRKINDPLHHGKIGQTQTLSSCLDVIDLIAVRAHVRHLLLTDRILFAFRDHLKHRMRLQHPKI